MELFFDYILPFLMLVLLVLAVAIRISCLGGPAVLFVVFFAIAFGPSLIYALVADASSGLLFGISFIGAAAVTALLALKFYKKT